MNSKGYLFIRSVSISKYLILLGVLLPSVLFASGKLKGLVTDSLSKDPLIGANIMLLGTAIGASANLDGSYDMPLISAGTYLVRCSYVGYLTKEIEVTIIDGQTAIVNFSLKMDVVEGKEITVSAQAIGQAAAINRQLSANTITNVVSIDKIMEIPDANAAESVGRLPGISILRDGGEGNKVTIRGLAPAYNAVTIGGDKIPSTDFNDRSVDMSMISSEILAGIEVTKALTPDQEADALGGTVEFKLSEAPKGGFKYNLRLQNGYNEKRNELGQYRGSLTVSNRFFDENLGVMITGNVEKVQRGSDVLKVSFEMPREKRAGEEFAPLSASSVRYNYINDVRKRTGITFLFDYQLPNGKILFNNFFSRLDRNKLNQERRFAVSGNYQYHNWIDEESQIDIMTNSLSGEHDISFFKLDWRLSRSESYSRLPYSNLVIIRETSAFDFTKMPEYRSADNLINGAKNKLEETSLYENYLDSEKSLERDLAGQINVQIPFQLTNDIVGRIKFGGKIKEKLKERDRGSMYSRLDGVVDGKRVPFYLEKYHSLYGTPGFKYKTNNLGLGLIENYLDQNFSANSFLNGKYEFGIGLNGNELNRFVELYLRDSLNSSSAVRDIDDYELTERVNSGYIMSEINFGHVLMILPGFRYEQAQLDMTGRKGNVPSDYDERPLDSPSLIQDTVGTKSYGNLFPMIHLRLKPVSWADLRMAYTKTIARPRLDFQLPKIRIDGTARRITLGNPNLNPQISTNLDAYLSFYGNQIGLIAGGVFSKKIDNLIYNREGHVILDPAKEGYETSWRGYSLDMPENSPFKTELYGAEIEWQTNLKWLPFPFDGLVLNINYTHVWSDTKYPRSIVRSTKIPTFPFIKTEVIDTFRVGKMINQANDIANFSLGYDYGDFSGRLSMLLQGKTLKEVGVREELDSFTDQYVRWDVMLKYDLTKYIGLYFNLNNFTSRPDRSYTLSNSYITAEEYYDWTADLGISIKIK